MSLTLSPAVLFATTTPTLASARSLAESHRVERDHVLDPAALTDEVLRDIQRAANEVGDKPTGRAGQSRQSSVPVNRDSMSLCPTSRHSRPCLRRF